MAEFEIERSAWTDREAMLTSGYHELEDIVDGKSLSLLWSSDFVSGRFLIFRLSSFLSWQTSFLVIHRSSLWPPRRLGRHEGEG